MEVALLELTRPNMIRLSAKRRWDMAGELRVILIPLRFSGILSRGRVGIEFWLQV